MKIESQIENNTVQDSFYKELYLDAINEADLNEERLTEILHEEIGSDLMALKMRIHQSSIPKEEKTLISNQIFEILEKIKGLRTEICPSLLTEMGIGEALKHRCGDLSNKHNIIIRYTQDGDKENFLKKELQAGLYKTVIKLLNGVIEYKAPSKILINALNKAQRYSIRIENDGDVSDNASDIDKEYPVFLEHIKGRLVQMDATLQFENDQKRSVITININK